MSSEASRRRRQQQHLDDFDQPMSELPSPHSDCIMADVSASVRDRDRTRRSGLSLDDLSSDGHDIRVDDADDAGSSSDRGDCATQVRARDSCATAEHSPIDSTDGADRNGDNSDNVSGSVSTQRVEAKLQQNLRRQQQHYARQRQLFEDLRSAPAPTAATRGTAVSPSVFSSSSCSSDDVTLTHKQVADSAEPTGTAAAVSSRRRHPLDRQSTGAVAKATTSNSDHDALRRVQAKAQSEYERRMAACQLRQSRRLRFGISSKHIGITCDNAIPSGCTVDALQQQETANDALRKQLELLRRLQVENSRFRRDARASRDTAAALEAQSATQQRELERVRDDVQRLRDANRELVAALAHEQQQRATSDQQQRAASAQTTRQLTRCEKQLRTVEREREHLQTTLHGAIEQHERSCAQAVADANDHAAERKRLKRTLKQLQQREAHCVDENELLRSSIEALEVRAEALERDLLVQARATSDVTSQLADKANVCEALEAGATATAQRMDSTVAALQKALDAERSRRKQLETERTTLQMRVDALESDVSDKQQCVESLERHVAQFQDRVRDKKRAVQQLQASADARADELLSQQQQHAHTVARLRDELLTEQEQHAHTVTRLRDELLAEQEQHTQVVAKLRDEHDRIEQQHEADRTAAMDDAVRLAVETKTIRADIDELRNYIASSCAAAGGTGIGTTGTPVSTGTEHVDTNRLPIDNRTDDNDNALQLEASRARTRNYDSSAPTASCTHELQLLQGAASALRAETMNAVHELQRARHATQQYAKQLALARDRVGELEQLCSDDTATMLRLREQRALAEQARDIASDEKRDVLQWGQQACAKSEAFAAELERCDELARILLHTLQRGHEATADTDNGNNDNNSDDDSSHAAANGHDRRRRHRKRPTDQSSARTPSLHFRALERAAEQLLTAHASQHGQLEQLAIEHREAADAATALQRELEAAARESERSAHELELLHAANARERRAHFDAAVRDLERDKRELAAALHDATTQHEVATSANAALTSRVERLERDAQELTALAQLLALVAPPLVLQVAELLAQKRYLLRANARYAHAQLQVESVAHVLQTLAPPGVAAVSNQSLSSSSSRTHRHQCFRRVLVAVFALNRFVKSGVAHQQQQAADVHGTDSADGSGGSSSFGACSSLVAPRRRRTSRGATLDAAARQRNPPATVIKVRVCRAAAVTLDLPHALERLRAIGAADKLAVLLAASESDASAASAHVGDLLVQVLAAIDPSGAETLADNTVGAFHCDALVTRRDLQTMSSATTSESTVDVIRTRVLALGKRVEDLLFQRNALQTHNYDLQLVIEQQAAQLEHTAALGSQLRELEHELADAHAQAQRERDAAQQTLDTKCDELEQTQRRVGELQQALTAAESQHETLRNEAAALRESLAAADRDAQTLTAETARLKQQVIDNDERADAARAGATRLEDEVRSLKQSARRAHELHVQTNAQLEREVDASASLRAARDALQQQKAALEHELRSAKLRDAAQSLSVDASPVTQRAKRRSSAQRVRFAAAPSSRQQRRADDKESDGDDDGVDNSDDDGVVNSDDDQLASTTRLTGASGAHSGSSRRRAAAARASALEHEDECLYHKYEKSLCRVDMRSDSDSDSDGDGNDASSRTSALLTGRPLDAPIDAPSASDASSRFQDEWQRLQLASAFDDSAQPLQPSAATVSTATTMAAATAAQVARAAAIESNRRRIEVDKVNAAVHDYMDRIDEKLQQMYGIPPSTAAARASDSRASDSDTETKDDDALDHDRRDNAMKHRSARATPSSRHGKIANAKPTMASPATQASARSHAKVDETRQWFG